jgi:DNA-binding winged helix-turn-helix (wHTH) protein
MVSPASVPTKIRFDSFELDVTSGELRKGRNRLRLQPQPFRVLLLLIERTGQVVAREEIQRCLWKDSTFVDFEHGINFSINQIRGALSDSAERPRYIETVPRRGYRFIGTVEQPSPTKQDSPQEPTPPPLQAEPLVAPPARKRWPAVVALTLLAAAIASGA